MADVNRGNRPLSPFMIGPYYRPQITSISSIMVRITAIASLGTATLIVGWLLLAAFDPKAFEEINECLDSAVGMIALLAAVWAITYHVLGRIRHVVWDFGYCLDVKLSEKLGWGMFILATVITACVALAMM